MASKASRSVHMTALKRAVAKHGGTWDGGPIGRMQVWQLEAPPGCVWNASGTHLLRVDWYAIDSADRVAAITDALERVALGASACDDPECEFCHPE